MPSSGNWTEMTPSCQTPGPEIPNQLSVGAVAINVTCMGKLLRSGPNSLDGGSGTVCRWMNTAGSSGDTGTSVYVLTQISIKLVSWSEPAVPHGADAVH